MYYGSQDVRFSVGLIHVAIVASKGNPKLLDLGIF